MEPLVPSVKDISEGVSWRPFVVLEVPVSNAGNQIVRRHDDSPSCVGNNFKDSPLSPLGYCASPPSHPHALLLIYLWSENPGKEEDE